MGNSVALAAALPPRRKPSHEPQLGPVLFFSVAGRLSFSLVESTGAAHL